MKGGRTSLAELSIVIPGEAKQLYRAPDELTREQAQIWKNILEALPDGWIKPATFSVLVELCKHVCRARALEREISNFCSFPRRHDKLLHMEKLFIMAGKESRSICQLSKALRLTPSSWELPRSADRRLVRNPGKGNPWDEMNEDEDEDEDD